MRLPLTLLVAASAIACGCAGVSRGAPASTPTAQAVEALEPPPVASPAKTPQADMPPSASVPQADDDSSDGEDGVMHIVQPGQTLWRIARAYDVPLEALAERNGIGNPTRVEVGTPIFIPGARATIAVAPYPAPPPSGRGERAVRPPVSADFIWPVDGGAFMRPFGEKRRHHTHAGVDIRGARGQDILAARDGVVAFSGSTKTGYGTMVVLDHGDGVQTVYAHAQSVLVTPGEAVRRGQPIALVGRSGNATTEHCHFEIRLANRAVDPMSYLLGTTEARR